MPLNIGQISSIQYNQLRRDIMDSRNAWIDQWFLDTLTSLDNTPKSTKIEATIDNDDGSEELTDAQ